MRQDFYFDRVHGYLYESTVEAEYSLLIAHGIGGNGGTYDVFCYPLAGRGVNIVSMDLPGHGLARGTRGNWRFREWLEDIHLAATAMKARWGKPVFILGSSMGSTPAFHSLAFSDAITGAITMTLNLNELRRPGTVLVGGVDMQSEEAHDIAAREGDTRRIDLATALDWNKNYAADDPDILARKMSDTMRPWSYGFASWHSMANYKPPIPAAANTKPVFVTVGENDPLAPVELVRASYDAIGGPKDFAILPGGTHQLMLYHTDQYIALVDGWVREQLSRYASGSTIDRRDATRTHEHG
jgi:alpha-beta hydrolase superfamily lysophospholipase